MGCPWEVANRGRKPYGWGVFDGAAFDLVREQWVATEAEALALKAEWEANPLPPGSKPLFDFGVVSALADELKAANDAIFGKGSS